MEKLNPVELDVDEEAETKGLLGAASFLVVSVFALSGADLAPKENVVGTEIEMRKYNTMKAET